MPTPTYDLLASSVLTTATASVTFSSISQDYRDLVLVADYLGSGGNATLNIRFNADTGSNYSKVFAEGTGSSAFSGSTTSTALQLGVIGASTTVRMLSVSQVLDYTATDKHKSGVSRINRVDASVDMTAFRYASTSAINQLEVRTFSNQFASGSSFHIYGIKA